MAAQSSRQCHTFVSESRLAWMILNFLIMTWIYRKAGKIRAFLFCPARKMELNCLKGTGEGKVRSVPVPEALQKMSDNESFEIIKAIIIAELVLLVLKKCGVKIIGALCVGYMLFLCYDR